MCVFVFSSDNRQSLQAINSSPKVYDNRIHVSEIYGDSKIWFVRDAEGMFGAVCRCYWGRCSIGQSNNIHLFSIDSTFVCCANEYSLFGKSFRIDPRKESNQEQANLSSQVIVNDTFDLLYIQSFSEQH